VRGGGGGRQVLQEDGLAAGTQYRIERFTFPSNTSTPDVDWTIVVVVDLAAFSSAYLVDYLIGLPVLGLILLCISVVAAVILIVSLTRPLRRIAEQLNAVAQLKIKARTKRRRAPAAAAAAAWGDEPDHATGAGSWFGRFVRVALGCPPRVAQSHIMGPVCACWAAYGR
jgi:hypothetical protein